MSKKDITTGEEFENFLSFTMKYNVKPKKPSINQVVKRVRKELEEVANQLGLPITDNKVPIEWCKQGGRLDDELFVNLFAPLYWPAPKYKIVWNEEMKCHVAIPNKETMKIIRKKLADHFHK